MVCSRVLLGRVVVHDGRPEHSGAALGLHSYIDIGRGQEMEKAIKRNISRISKKNKNKLPKSILGKAVSPPSSTSDRYRKNVKMRGPQARLFW